LPRCGGSPRAWTRPPSIPENSMTTTTKIEETASGLMTPLRETLKAAREAAATMRTLEKIEADLDRVTKAVAEAPDAATALAYSDEVAKLKAQFQVAKVRWPQESAAAGAASQLADRVLSDTLQALCCAIVEPFNGRATVAASRLAFIATTDPGFTIPVTPGLTREAAGLWGSACAATLDTAERADCLEALIPRLPACLQRVELLEAAAETLKPLDDR
jgi:hypothetical protein